MSWVEIRVGQLLQRQVSLTWAVPVVLAKVKVSLCFPALSAIGCEVVVLSVFELWSARTTASSKVMLVSPTAAAENTYAPALGAVTNPLQLTVKAVVEDGSTEGTPEAQLKSIVGSVRCAVGRCEAPVV